MYFVWDCNQKWGERSASDSNNLIVVKRKTKTVTNVLMDYLNKNAEVSKIKYLKSGIKISFKTNDKNYSKLKTLAE